jgi:hypothetical protein
MTLCLFGTCNDRRLMHLDGASSILRDFRTCCVLFLGQPDLMLHPRFRYRVYGQGGFVLVSHRMLPLGETQTYPVRWEIGLLWACSCVRWVLGAPDDHVVAQARAWRWWCCMCVAV